MTTSQVPPALHGLGWTELLQEALDQELGAAASERLHTHLQHCSLCGDEFTRLRALDDMLKGIVARTLGASFERRVLEAIRDSDAPRCADGRRAARTRLEQEHAWLSSALERSWWRTRHVLLALLAATLTIAIAFIAASPTLAFDVARGYQGLVAVAGQVLIHMGLAVVVAIAGLTFGLRRALGTA